MNSTSTVVSGWGNSTPVGTQLQRPLTMDDVAASIPKVRPVIARGLGRSYGDAAQLAGDVTVQMTALDRIIAIDETSGVIRVEAGVTIAALIQELLPRGWFVPVVPGTKWVSVGGAIASDIHGKNHHRDGSFGSHLMSITLLDASGNIRELSPSNNPEQFWATVGGMGLTGIILEAEISMRRVSSAQMWATQTRVHDLDSLMATMQSIDEESPYSVAWIDALSKGSVFGRGVISHGDHATPTNFPAGADPFQLDTDRIIDVPRTLPNGLLNRLSVRSFNELWFRAAKTGQWRLTPLSSFFHPLDRVGLWNRIYGSRGFIQYQFAVPNSGEKLIQRAIETLQSVGVASFLSVLKRFGAGNDGPLSFPTAGWTLALDLPTNTPGLGGALDELDQDIAATGGRVYLSKDARLRPDVLTMMYPRLADWQQVRAEMGAVDRFESDLSRRLNL